MFYLQWIHIYQNRSLFTWIVIKYEKLKVGHAVDASFCLLLLYFYFCFTPEEMFLSVNVPSIPIIWTFQLVFMNAKVFFFLMLSWTSVQHFIQQNWKKNYKDGKKTSVFFLQWKRKTYKTFASTSKLKIAKKRGQRHGK